MVRIVACLIYFCSIETVSQLLANRSLKATKGGKHFQVVSLRYIRAIIHL